MKEYLALTIGAILVNNFVLSKFLGICPFLGTSKRFETALGMGGSVIFVMGLASFVTSLIFNVMLVKPISVFGIKNIDVSFLQLLIFIVVIAALVQIVEIIMQKSTPGLYKALGIYLPLITTNCAVLGVATINANVARGVFQSTVYGTFSGIGFALALVLFASIREKLETSHVPAPFKGIPIALITAGILAMAFIGFSGLC